MRSKHGFTLIEILVAVSLGVLIIGMAFGFWNFVNRHTITQTQKSSLLSESHRIGRQISDQLRQSTGVIEWDREHVVYVSGKTGDTVNLVYTDNCLMQNDLPIARLDTAVHIVSFCVTEKDRFSTADNDFLYLTVTIDFGTIQAGGADALLKQEYTVGVKNCTVKY